MTDSATLTVQTTKNCDWDKAYNVQLTAGALNEHFTDLAHGSFLLVEADHDGTTFSAFGKVDVRETDHLGDGDVGIGLHFRYALGVTVGTDVRVRHKELPNGVGGQLGGKFDEILGSRPVLCRVRTAVHPDIGFNVCRIDQGTMDELGIGAGDRVVVESTRKPITVKALPLRSEIETRKHTQTEENPDRYPDPVSTLGLGAIAGTSIDIPAIYLDAERRSKLQLTEQAGSDSDSPLHTGHCQPVKVYRNATSAYLRSLNDVTVPVVVGLFATLVIFDEVLSPVTSIVIVIAGILLILFSISYRVSRAALD